MNKFELGSERHAPGEMSRPANFSADAVVTAPSCSVTRRLELESSTSPWVMELHCTRTCTIHPRLVFANLVAGQLVQSLPAFQDLVKCREVAGAGVRGLLSCETLPASSTLWYYGMAR